MGTHGKGTRCGRHNERLRVVHHERLEGAVGTLDHRLLSFDEVQDIEAALGVVRRSAGEPVPAGLDELALVEASPLLLSAVFHHRKPVVVGFSHLARRLDVN